MRGSICLLLATTAIQTSAVLATRAAQLVTALAAGPASISAGGNSFGPSISGDGRRIAFVSHAGNLVTNETLRESLQVFVRDLVTSNTLLVSVGTNGRGGDFNSFAPTVSSNGQFVAFASEAGSLVTGDTNDASDVFVRDLTAGTTRLVSIDLTGHAPSDTNRNSIVPLSGNPLISAEARWVFFESRATNLTSELDSNAAVDVFRRDLQSNTTVLVTRSLVATQTANAGSALCSVTPDGQRAAFIGTAIDLVPGVGSSRGDVYVGDLRSNTMHWASASLTNYGSGYRCVSAALSENGGFVAFIVVPLNGPPALYRRDLEAAAPLLAAMNVLERSALAISADGRFIVFEDGTNVFRFDGNTGTNELVNVTTMGLPPVSGIARNPVVTADGNGIVFISDCPDLVTNNSTFFQIYARDMAAGRNRLITGATNGQANVTNTEASLMAVARDFSRVAFDSTASDLAEGDGNRATDVFVRDLATDRTSLVSQRETSRPRDSGVAHAFVRSDCVSADGRFIAFTSYDNDAWPDDANARPDVFIRDRLTGTVMTPGFSTNAARSPAMSANGRYVAYLQRNPALASETSGGAVWRFDREAATNVLVDASAQTDPAISPDGNLVAFVSGNFFPGINLIVRDMGLQTTYTVAAADPALNRKVIFTPNGRFVLFTRSSGIFSLYAWDSVLRQLQLVSNGGGNSLAVSGNSRFLAFTTGTAIYLRDLIAGTNQLLRIGAITGRTLNALNGDGTLLIFSDNLRRLLALNRVTGEESIVAETGDFVDAPAVSADGRFVVYTRRVRMGGGFQASFSWQLYVRDRTLGTTTLISAGPEGTNSNGHVSRGVLAADGRTVVFHAAASDLVPGDFNDKHDVFVLKLGGADTDGDGMDDDWEAAYFGNLSRDGNGDLDDDGVSDLQEFRAGTDPTSSNSVFRVLTVTPMAGGNTRVMWTGNPNRSYRVEFKDDLSAADWTALDGTISWNGSTASIDDPTVTNSTHRYYRALRLP